MRELLLILLLFSPALLAQVSVVPAVFTSIPGGSATFSCGASTLGGGDSIIDIQWQLNNTSLDMLELNNVIATFIPQTSIGLLTFSSISQDLNMTNVTCLSNLASGLVEISFYAAVLLVQGLLSAVSSLNITASDTTLSLTWEPPFTLDINGVLDDITGYCVDMINSTSSVTVHSECNIIETTFTYPIPEDADCHVYNFTVIPVNIVGNGTEDTASYIGVQASPAILKVFPDSTSILSFLAVTSAPICQVEIISVDADTGERIATRVCDFTGSNITFTVAKLTANHHYNFSITASNAAGTATSVHQISTHAIEAVTLFENGAHGISFMVTYDCGTVLGALFSFVFITDSGTIDFTRSQLLPVDRNSSVLPIQLAPGQYQVHVYDIEQDGTLINSVNYPAVSKEFVASVEGLEFSVQTPHLDDCNIFHSSRLINAVCSYSTNSIAAGFLVITQKNPLNEVHKLYINQTTHQQNSVSMEVEDIGLYLVSVIPILEGTGITNSRVEYREVIMVMTGTNTDIEVVTTAVNIQSKEMTLSIAIGLLAFVVAILCGITIAQCLKIHFKHHKQTKKVETKLPTSHAEENRSFVDENQLYAEIKDPEEAPCLSTRATENVGAGLNPTANIAHNYKNTEIRETTLCVAYGVVLETK